MYDGLETPHTQLNILRCVMPVDHKAEPGDDRLHSTTLSLNIAPH